MVGRDHRLARVLPQPCRDPGENARRRRGVPVYTHVYESRTQRVFCQTHLRDYGGSAIRYMDATGLLGPSVTIAHGVWPELDEIELIARSGTSVVLNMLSNLKLKSGVA